MDKGHIILGIVLFAAATAVLYVWGLKKSAQQRDDLNRILLNRCGNRIIKYLRKHGEITTAQIAQQINGVTASEFWSRKRLTVQDPKKFSQTVLDFLLDQQFIETAGKNRYRLKK